MGWTFPDNHISINARISFGAAWNDVDLGTNNDVPSGTVAVILKIRNTGGSNRASVRPNGNTAYTYTNALATNSINYLIVKLDANRVFEGFFASDYLMVVVVGYTDSDTLFQNFVNKSLTTTGSYQTEDVSGDGVPAGASVAVVNIIQTAISAAYNFALRPIGASYDYYKAWSYNAAAGYAPSTYWPVGLDANRQFEHKITNVAVDAYLWGYFGSEVVMLSTPVSKAPGSTGWQDIDVSADVPSNAIAAIFQVVGGATGTYGVNFRKNGSTDNLTTSISMSYLHHLVHWVGLDANKICECYQSTTGFYVYLVGYVIPPSGSYTLSAGSGSYDESGIAQTLKKTSLLTLAVGSYVETGTAATLKWGRKVDATTAAFSVIGTVASLERGYKVNLGTTFFSITGTVASLKRGYRVDIGSTLFAITGTAASLKRGYKVDVGSALFSVTGTVAGLFRGYKVAAGSGSFTYTGQNATLSKTTAAKEIDADPGSYSMTGNLAALLLGRKLIPASGSYSLAGDLATLLLGRELIPAPGSCFVTGDLVALLLDRKLITESGGYVKTGTPATLEKASKIIADLGVYLFGSYDADLYYSGPMIIPTSLNVSANISYLLSNLQSQRLIGEAQIRKLKVTSDE